MFVSDIKLDFTFENFRQKETYKTITTENLEYALTNWLLW